MRQATHRIQVRTRGKGLYEISAEVAEWVREARIRAGLLTLFIQHTSASLTIQENADRDVILDLNDAFGRLAPEDSRLYRHTIEGSDDMPAHIRTVLSGVHLSIPVVDGHPGLGTWQGIYLFEHRTAPHIRSVLLHLFGE